MSVNHWTQLGFDHGTRGFPYLWKLDRSKATEQQIMDYARGFLLSAPEGKNLERKYYPGNIVPAIEDAKQDVGIMGFLKALVKAFC